jgi:hypothetical protein
MDRRKLTKDLPETENFNFLGGRRFENPKKPLKPGSSLALGPIDIQDSHEAESVIHKPPGFFDLEV